MYKRQYHRPIFILFCSLGFSDLLTTFSSFYVTLLFMAKPDSTVYGTEELLKVYSAFSVAVLSALYNLMSIGIERCLSVAACLRARHTVSEWQSLAAVSVNWGLAMLLGCLPVAGWNCLHTGETSNLYSPLCMDYLIFVTIPNCLVTFTILFGTYVTIIVKLRKHKTAVAAFGASVVNTYRQAEARVTRTSVFIWFLAMASYLPFFAGVLWDASKPLCPQQLTTGIFVFRNMTSIMFAVNSIGNPLLYTLKFKSVGKTLNALKCPTRQKVNVSAVAPV
ncbi:lysophosphatidic acid receptor 1-A-like [Lepisosteus oculatus]|uniref:lysophosphatidic acid receptor 1-A-like n=1 Tax=Lepisosteus oculatus TaxID=7918 RepID=UPI0003EACEC6|nr:PREDICTED: sphingosine 1-phosphate receptor 1-like [Lepisosteus oculatus]